MVILQILLKALERIGTHNKWCKYWSVSDDGKRLCATSAIGWAAGCSGPLSHYTADAFAALHILANCSGVNPAWSDYDRVAWRNADSHKAVMDMFEQAINQSKGV